MPSRKVKIRNIVLSSLLATGICICVSFIFVTKISFSAYATCRKLAMNTKGYGVWEHRKTEESQSTATIWFSDGVNTLTCQAVPFGPFWVVDYDGGVFETITACYIGFGPEGECPRDYTPRGHKLRFFAPVSQG